MTRNEALFLTALTVLLWALMPATQMWDWDEPLYARTGIEMYEAGNLLLPQFNGEVFAHKPPLGYWIMGFAAQLFGETEFAARFFSAPALALAVFLTGRSGAILFGQQAGFAAMVICATGFMSIYLGAAAMMDAYLMFGCALAIWAMLHILDARRASLPMLVWFAVGGLITLLVKGPVGPAIIGGMALAVFVFLPRQDRPSWAAFFALVAAGAVAIAGFAMWFIPANAASEGELVSQGIGIHIIGRALAPMEGHGGNGIVGFLLFLPIYIPVILLGMLPWTGWTIGAVGHVFGGIARRERVILLSWFLPTFILFSIAATKLPHYIFPAFAPLAVAIGGWITSDTAKSTKGGIVISTILYGILAAFLAWVAVSYAGAVSSGLVGLAALGFVLIAILLWRLPVSIGSVLPLALVSLAVFQLFYWGGLREVEKLIKVSKPLGAAIQTYAPEDAPVFMAGYREPSLAFYASRPIDNPIYPATARDFAVMTTDYPQGFVVLTEPQLTTFAEAAGDLGWRVVAQAAARNFNRNGVEESVLLVAWSAAAE